MLSPHFWEFWEKQCQPSAGEPFINSQGTGPTVACPGPLHQGGGRYRRQIHPPPDLASLVLVVAVSARGRSCLIAICLPRASIPSFERGAVCFSKRLCLYCCSYIHIKIVSTYIACFYSFLFHFQMLAMTVLAVVKEFHLGTLSLMGCTSSEITMLIHTHYMMGSNLHTTQNMAKRNLAISSQF